MKRLLIICAVLVGVLLWGLFLTESKREKGRGSGFGDRQRAQKAEDKKESPPIPESQFASFIHDPEADFIESPIPTDRNADVLGKAISERNDSVYTFVPPGVPLNVPMIELRFFRRATDSTLRPLYVRQAYIGPWKKGKTVSGKREELKGSTSIKANAFRVGVSDEKGSMYGTLLAGRIYYLLLYPKKGTFEPHPERGESFEVLFQVPESIPEKKMAIVNIVAEYRYPELMMKMKKLRGDTPKSISGTISGSMPVNPKRLRAGYYPRQGGYKRAKVGSDKEFNLEADKLGGMLRVTEMKRQAVGWIYIHSVKKRNLKLPRDADLVIREKQLVPFRLKIPPGKIKDDLAGVSLKVNKDDEMPMAWVNFNSTHDNNLQELKTSGTLEMRFVPGECFVEALYWPEGTEWSERKLEILGRVRITKSDAGKTVKVQPLEE